MAEPGAPARAAALGAALLVLYLVLAQPNHPEAATWGALRVFPLELPVLVILLVLAGGRLRVLLRCLLTAVLTLLCLVKAADLAAHLAYARPFNPMLDLHLLPASWRMLRGAAGAPRALGLLGALLLATALTGAAIWWATGRIARLKAGVRWRPGLALAAIAFSAVALADAWREASPVNPPGAAFTSRLAYEHLRDIVRARADLALFRAEAARDPFAALPPDRLLTGLRGTDVMVVFVESYGRTALENPLYATRSRTTLDSIARTLGARGLAMRSAWLTAPMVGGQSWLSHASLLSGLAISDQGRYEALLTSPRRTLVHLAQGAGWRTVAVMPGISLAWPEAGYFEYDRVLTASDLGYRGKPFDWVTMPDQFALAAFERAELGPRPRAPVFAEIALISSHAPWTPIPPLLPWAELGDGQVFDPFTTGGDPPEVIWRDPDRIRAQYGRSLDYSLRAVGAFAERHAGAAPLFIVLGDHQPVPLVSQGTGGRDVPVHLIGPPALLSRIDAWGWTPGLLPAPDAPVWEMPRFRDRFLAAFAAPP